MKTNYAIFLFVILGLLPAFSNVRRCRMRQTTDKIHSQKYSSSYSDEYYDDSDYVAYTPDFENSAHELVALENDNDLDGFFDQEEDDIVAMNDNNSSYDNDDSYNDDNNNYDDANYTNANNADDNQENDYSWEVAQVDPQENLKVVYFDYDNYSLKDNQKNTIVQNVKELKQTILDAGEQGRKVTVVAEGHSSPESGSELYNMGLSEKRAVSVSQELQKLGIPKENIKVVGRGQEMPAILDGKVVTGSREQQWPNRRVELRVVSA